MDSSESYVCISVCTLLSSGRLREGRRDGPNINEKAMMSPALVGAQQRFPSAQTRSMPTHSACQLPCLSSLSLLPHTSPALKLPSCITCSVSSYFCLSLYPRSFSINALRFPSMPPFSSQLYHPSQASFFPLTNI